jgi:PleD family two-component response regulator
MATAPSTPRILVVEPNVRRRLTLQRALSAVADVTACGDFQTARQHILAMAPDLLITNMRLRAYNGLHLMALAGAGTRAIVCVDPPDPALVRTARAAGALVETPQRLAAAAVSRIGIRSPHKS